MSEANLTNLPRRRQPIRLPSRRKHALLAGAVLLLGLTIPIGSALLFGDAEDAVAQGSVALAQRPVAPETSALDNDTLDLPDLLAGEVPIGENPTERLVEPAPEASPDPATPQPKTIIVPPGPRTSLPAAPIAGLTRDATFGPVPQRGSRTILSAYKRPFTAQSGKAPVSVIIGGMGVNRALTQQAIDQLPPEVTLSFAAHAAGLQDWIDSARAAGHEVMIELPMEDTVYDPSSPGARNTLRLNPSDRQLERNLDWLLSRGQGYFGVTNFNGEAYLQRADAAAPLIDALATTGAGFITDGAFDVPTVDALAKTVGQPFKAGHGLIDPDPIPAVIKARLDNLARAATDGSHPVGVGFAYAETITATRDWIAELDARGLQLAPASASLK